MNQDLDESKKNIENLKKNVQDQSEESLKILSEASNELDKVKKTKASIYTDFIAILGVFSSFVFVMFGGFSALSNIIKSLSHTDVSMPKILLISSILFGFLITVLYSLLYWISLIIDKPIFNNNCDCKKTCTKIKHIFIKHRYYLIIMISCLIAFLISIILISYNIN